MDVIHRPGHPPSLRSLIERVGQPARLFRRVDRGQVGGCPAQALLGRGFLRSLGFARDFGSGLTRPLTASTWAGFFMFIRHRPHPAFFINLQGMPWGLKCFQECHSVHFLTFSCYRRKPNLVSASACRAFLAALERVREQYQLCVYGYVIMPEHVHLLVSEPDRGTLAQAMQSLKQGVARRLALRAPECFWQARTTISTSGAMASSSRSCATFTEIQ